MAPILDGDAECECGHTRDEHSAEGGCNGFGCDCLGFETPDGDEDGDDD